MRYHEAVTMALASHNTLPLLKEALTTFLGFYPTVPTIVVDNGSKDGSAEYIRNFGAPVTDECLGWNMTHGPALHLAMLLAETPYVFTLDSDTITKRGGFIELMTGMFEDDPNLFALGTLSFSDFRAVRPGKYPTVQPSAMMIRCSMYSQGRPFVQAGQPVHLCMADARSRGNRIAHFPINDYILHLKGGTRLRRCGGPLLDRDGKRKSRRRL